MSRIVGSAEVVIGPNLKGFAAKAHRDFKTKRITFEVPVNPELKRASAEMAAWRQRQERNAVKIPVEVDHQRLSKSMRRVENTFKASTLSRAIRVNVAVAGAASLPLLARGALSAAAAIQQLVQSTLVLPGILSGIGASVGVLATGLGGLSDAFKAAGEGSKNASENARDFARASRDLERAQRDIVKAMKDATREIEDQHDKLAQGALSVERAQLNVVRANQRLAAGGFKTYVDYRSAILDVKQANFDLNQSIKQNNRDIQDYYDNSGKSARQTDTFRDALDRLATATDSFTKAQEKASGSTQEFLDAMAGLSPAGREFVTQILSIKDAWKALQGAVQNSLLKDLGKNIKDLADRELPRLRDGMVRVAGGLNDQIKAVLGALGDSNNTKMISKFFENLSKSMTVAAPGIRSMVSGFIHLSEVGARFLPRLAFAFNRVMDRFDAFVARTDKDGSLERWIDQGLKLVASLGRSILHIGSILNSVTTAYQRATGKAGGLAETFEGSLKRLADYLASAKGQGALIGYIQKATEFLDIIKEAMPGIIDGFKAFAEAARNFAQNVFPIFAGIGSQLKEHLSLVKWIITAWMGWRTIAPIWRGMEKFWGRFKTGLEEYRKVQRETAAAEKAWAAEHSRLINQRVEAYREQRAAGAAYHTEELGRIHELRKARAASDTDIAKREAMLVELNAQAKNASKGAQGAEAQLMAAQTRAAKHARELDAARLNSAIAMNTYGELSAEHRTALNKEAKAMLAVQDATKNVAKWQAVRNETVTRGLAVAKAVDEQQDGLARSLRARHQLEVDAHKAGEASWGRYATATSKATEKVKLADKALKELSGGAGKTGTFSRLRTAIGGSGAGAIGALGALSGALGLVTSVIGGIAITGSMIYALNELAKAHDRAKWSAEEHRRMEQELANTLNEATGAATNATLKANVQELQHHQNPAKSGEFINASEFLQRQLGMDTQTQGKLALPTMVKQREARLAEADRRIIAAVPGLSEWREWGRRYKEQGVDETVYGRALAGDPDSVEKVKRAQHAIKDRVPTGRVTPMWLAAGTHMAPNDLGHAIEQLPPNLRETAQGVGALRAVGNANVAAGQDIQRTAQAFPIRLNARGNSAFGGFGIAPGGVASQDGESLDIAVDTAPSDGWVESVRDKGITVTPRQPSGAIIHIDPSAVKNYAEFQKVPGLAGGGEVWGAGTATSDSIPAMLSNGEFVLNAQAVKKYGAGLLHRMNALHFDDGGLVPDNPFLPPLPGVKVPTVWGNDPQGPGIQMPPFMGPSRGEGVPKTLPHKGPSYFDMLPEGLKRQTDLDILYGPNAAFGPPGKGSLKMPPGVGFQGSMDLLRQSMAGDSKPAPKPKKPVEKTSPAAPDAMPTLHHRSGAVLPGPASYVSTPGRIRIPTYEELGAGYDGQPGTGPEAGLQPNAINVRRAVQAAFPQLSNIGGWRPPDGYNEHSSGQAVDIMIPGWDTPEGKALGDEVSKWVLSHAAQFGVDYTIWQHGQHDPDGTFTPYPDKGSDNANHMNHVHVHVAAGPPASGAVGQFPGIDLGSGIPGMGGVPGLGVSGSGGGSSYLRTTNLGARAVGGIPGSTRGILNMSNGIPWLTAMPEGPFGPVPFTALDFANQIGNAFLTLVGGFFGIDLTQITGLINQIFGGMRNMGQGGIDFDPADMGELGFPADPGPDPTVIRELIAQAADAKAQGNEALSRSLLQSARDYQSRAVEQSIDMPSLSGESGKMEVASRIIAEAQRRGYTPEQTIAILSTAMQESGLNPAAAGGGGAWHGIFQQDTSYPGRDDPGLNIGAFFDRLEGKGGPQSPDIWKSIFWLQQRPGEASADAAFANGRQAYMSEIQSQLGPAQSLYQNIMGSVAGLAGGGHVRGPGGPTDDRVPAMLSAGEFVLRAKAVDKYGPGLLHQMNSMSLPHMAGGGLLPPMPAPVGPAPVAPVAPAAPAPMNIAPVAPAPAPTPGPSAAGQQLGAAQKAATDAAVSLYMGGPDAGPSVAQGRQLGQAVFDARKNLQKSAMLQSDINSGWDWASQYGSSGPIVPVPPLPADIGVQSYPEELTGFSAASDALSRGSWGFIPDVAKDYRTLTNWGGASGADQAQVALDAAGFLPLPIPRVGGLAKGVAKGLEDATHKPWTPGPGDWIAQPGGAKTSTAWTPKPGDWVAQPGGARRVPLLAPPTRAARSPVVDALKFGNFPSKSLEQFRGRVAKPVLDNDNFLNEALRAWQLALLFNNTKGFIRGGVHDAISSGYRGLGSAYRELHADALYDMRELVGKGISFPTIFQDTEAMEALRYAGQEFAARAVHSAPSKDWLWRGLSLSDSELAGLAPGKTTSFPLSSFGNDLSSAGNYAKPGPGKWWQSHLKGQTNPVVFGLAPGAHAVDLSDGWMDEVLAFGKFGVADVIPPNKDTDFTQVLLRQLGFEHPAPTGSAFNTGADGFAGGGRVTGPGGPRGDKIPAMLSSGEFVLNAQAVKKYGPGLLHRMNAMGVPHLAGGGLLPFNVLDPIPNAPAPGPLPKEQAPAIGAAPGMPGTPQAPEQAGGAPPPAPDAGVAAVGAGAPAGAGPQPLGPQAGQPGSSEEGSQNVAEVLGGVTPGVGGASGSQPGAAPAPGANDKQDPRGILGSAPQNQNHNNQALDRGVKGAFQYVGSMAAQAAAIALAGGTMGAGAAASPAVASAIQGGAQIAGEAATGAMNVLSSLMVGTLTPGTTGQGYGAPLLPQQPGQTPVRQFQSIQNGDIYTNNLDDWKRTQDRREAQRALPYLNRT